VGKIAEEFVHQVERLPDPIRPSMLVVHGERKCAPVYLQKGQYVNTKTFRRALHTAQCVAHIRQLLGELFVRESESLQILFRVLDLNNRLNGRDIEGCEFFAESAVHLCATEIRTAGMVLTEVVLGDYGPAAARVEDAHGFRVGVGDGELVDTVAQFCCRLVVESKVDR
jgi:hypothetical protein